MKYLLILFLIILLEGCFSLCFIPPYSYRNTKALQTTKSGDGKIKFNTDGYYYHFYRNDLGEVVSIKYFVIFNDKTVYNNIQEYNESYHKGIDEKFMFKQDTYNTNCTMGFENEILRTVDSSVALNSSIYNFKESWGNWRLIHDTLITRVVHHKKQCINDIFQSKLIIINDSTLLPISSGWINNMYFRYQCDTCFFHYRKLIEMPKSSNKSDIYWKY